MTGSRASGAPPRKGSRGGLRSDTTIALIAIAVALCVPAAAQGEGPRNGARPSRGSVLDPVYVFYPRGACNGDHIELQVWNREHELWLPHADHPRVPIESCQLEDAGALLNEIRWRCVEKRTPGAEPEAWVVGLNVFDPEVMERCSVGRRSKSDDKAWIRITEPSLDTPVRTEEPRTPLVGSVAIDGIGGTNYDVVIALDVSDAVRSGDTDLLKAQVDAARSFVRRIGPQLGGVRIGVVTFPNVRPSRKALGGTGARREIPPTASAAEIHAALRRVAARGTAGTSSYGAGLEFALEEVLGRKDEAFTREDARKVVLLAADGRKPLPFGPAADSDGPHLEEARARIERLREAGVTLHLFALGGLAEEPPKVVRDLISHHGGSFRRVMRPEMASAFFEEITLPFVREVRITNLRNGEELPDVRLDSNGQFTTELELRRGPNRLVVTALTSDGRRREREVTVEYDDTLLRERLLEMERARMRALRKKVIVAPEGRDQ